MTATRVLASASILAIVVPIALLLAAIWSDLTGGGVFLVVMALASLLPAAMGFATWSFSTRRVSVWPSGVLVLGLVNIAWMVGAMRADTYDSGPVAIWLGFGLTAALFSLFALIFLAIVGALTPTVADNDSLFPR